MKLLIVMALTTVLAFSVGGCCKCEEAPEAAAAEAAEAPEEEATVEEAPAEEPEEGKENDDAE